MFALCSLLFARSLFSMNVLLSVLFGIEFYFIFLPIFNRLSNWNVWMTFRKCINCERSIANNHHFMIQAKLMSVEFHALRTDIFEINNNRFLELYATLVIAVFVIVETNFIFSLNDSEQYNFLAVVCCIVFVLTCHLYGSWRLAHSHVFRFSLHIFSSTQIDFVRICLSNIHIEQGLNTNTSSIDICCKLI